MKTKPKKSPALKKRPAPKKRPGAKQPPVAKKRRPSEEVWQLRLYVSDRTHRSLVALANLRRICETHLKGRYRITVIDLLKKPQLAKGDQILAIPTVVRRLPHPVRTIIGTLSHTENVLLGLDLRAGL